MASESSSSSRKTRRADLTRKAADLRIDGLSQRAIASELGISHPTVKRMLDDFCENHPMESVERLRAVSLERTDRALAVAMELLGSDDPDTRLEAAKTIARIERIRGDIAGFVKQAPPAVVTVTNNLGADLSKLDIDEVRTWRALALKARRTDVA